MPPPCYLAKDRHGAFMFGRGLPPAVRPYFQNRRELRKSLRAYRRAVAIRRARALAARLDEMAERIEELDELDFAKGQYDGRIEELAAEIAQMYATERKPFEERLVPLLVHSASDPSHEAELGAAIADVKAYSERVQRLCDERKRLILKSEALERHIAELRHETGRALLHTELVVAPAKAWPAPVTARGEPISSYWAKYDAEKLRTGQWKHNKTAEENREAFRSFLDVVGDLSTSEITRDVCMRYAEAMQDYPTNRFRGGNAALTLETRASADPSTPFACLA